MFDMSPLSLEDIQCEGTGTDQECTGDQTLSCAHQTCQNVKIEIVFYYCSDIANNPTANNTT